MNTCRFALVLLALVGTAQADEYVNGYVRKDGTYVQPHYRTAPDSTIQNNYSTQGNVNPYTGQPGTVNPYPQQQFQPMQTQPLQPSNNSRKSGYQ